MLKDKERQIIEQRLIPALEKIPPFHFDSLEWWDQQPRKTEPAQPFVGTNAIEAVSRKSALMKWLRSF